MRKAVSFSCRGISRHFVPFNPFTQVEVALEIASDQTVPDKWDL